MDEGDEVDADPDPGIGAEARDVLLKTLLRMTGKAALRAIHQETLAMAGEWEGVIVLRPGPVEEVPQRLNREVARLVAAELARRSSPGG